MKRSIVLSVLCVLALLAPSLATAGYGGGGAGKATAGLDKLKSLAGEWQATDPEGKRMTVTYEVVSNGSVVMETISHSAEPDMITMFHIDGDRLMMTHYCGLGNQPRMKASIPAGDIKELKFTFIDGSNMKKSDMHMHGLVMTFVDDGHLTADWSLYDKGKATGGHSFSLTRKL